MHLLQECHMLFRKITFVVFLLYQTTTASNEGSSGQFDVLKTGSGFLPTTPSKKIPYVRLALGKRPKWHLGRLKVNQVVFCRFKCY